MGEISMPIWASNPGTSRLPLEFAYSRVRTRAHRDSRNHHVGRSSRRLHHARGLCLCRVGAAITRGEAAADDHGDGSYHRVCISLFLLLRPHDDDVPHRRAASARCPLCHRHCRLRVLCHVLVSSRAQQADRVQVGLSQRSDEKGLSVVERRSPSSSRNDGRPDDGVCRRSGHVGAALHLVCGRALVRFVASHKVVSLEISCSAAIQRATSTWPRRWTSSAPPTRAYRRSIASRHAYEVVVVDGACHLFFNLEWARLRVQR